jgi:CheY-like chemotaxis protein
MASALSSNHCLSPHGDTKRMLVVGDGVLLGDFLTSDARSAEFSVDRCVSHPRALDLLAKRSYDLVLSCDQTPVWDDVQLLVKLRLLRVKGLKFIIVAADATPQDVIEAMRAHAFCLFTVPFDRAALLDMIEMGLDASVWSDGIEVVSAKPEWLALRVRCSRITAERLVQFGREMQIDLPEPLRDAIMLSFRELLLNGMEHGAGFNPNLKVDVGYLRTSRLLLYYLRDPGEGFQLKTADHAAINNPPHDELRHMAIRVAKGLRAGGFGLKLAHSLMDELVFNEFGNEVVVMKYL